MFSEVTMRQVVLLKPDELGEGVFFQKSLIGRLLENVKKVPCTEEHGYIVTVRNIKTITDGIIRADTGSVVFWVEFNAITFNLEMEEVLEAEVEKVSDKGCICYAGPINIFLPAGEMPDFEYKHGVDTTYNRFLGRDGGEITNGSIIRLRINHKRWKREERQHGYAGTLAGDFLGLVPDFSAENLQSRQGDEGPAHAVPDDAPADDVDVLMPDANFGPPKDARSKGGSPAPQAPGEEETVEEEADSEDKSEADSEDQPEAGLEDQPAESSRAASPSPAPATKNSKTGRGRAARIKVTRVVSSDDEDNVLPRQQKGRRTVVELSDDSE